MFEGLGRCTSYNVNCTEGMSVFSTNKTECLDLTEMFLKRELNSYDPAADKLYCLTAFKACIWKVNKIIIN
jgi:hypothetical protein